MGKLVAVVAVIALALGAAGVTFGVTQRGDATSQAARLQAEITAQWKALLAYEKVAANAISALTQPSDPLSAYNEVCSFDPDSTATYPSSDANNSLLYLPCTDEGQTVPQPG